MAKISVVIPSYNHDRYIGAALDSLEQQSFRDFDVTIVDDGSTDGSVAAIEAFQARSRLPVTLIAQPNAGADAALNRGIAASRGEIVAILNSDDAYHPERLETVLAAAPRHTPFIAFSEFTFMGEQGQAIPDDPHNVWYREALAENTTMPSLGFMLMRSNISVSTSNYVFSRALYDAAGPFRPFKTAHDLDFLLRCVTLVEPLFVRTPLLRYRIHGASTLKANRDVEFREVRTILDDYIGAVSARPPANAVAPGARQMPLYSAYFLADRDHWSGPLAGELRQALLAALDAAATRRDALALRREVDRLTAELRRALEAASAQDHAVQAEKELHVARAAQANVLARLEVLQNSTSWRITAPLRGIVEACRGMARRA